MKYSGDTRYDQKADLQEVFVATHDDPYAAKATSASALMPLEAHTDEWEDRLTYKPEVIEGKGKTVGGHW